MLAAGPLLRPYVYTYIEHCAASGGILATRCPAACVLLAAAWRSASASASAWQPTGNSSKIFNEPGLAVAAHSFVSRRLSPRRHAAGAQERATGLTFTWWFLIAACCLDEGML